MLGLAARLENLFLKRTKKGFFRLFLTFFLNLGAVGVAVGSERHPRARCCGSRRSDRERFPVVKPRRALLGRSQPSGRCGAGGLTPNLSHTVRVGSQNARAGYGEAGSSPTAPCPGDPAGHRRVFSPDIAHAGLSGA